MLVSAHSVRREKQPGSHLPNPLMPDFATASFQLLPAYVPKAEVPFLFVCFNISSSGRRMWELGEEVAFLEQPVAPAITLSNTQQLCFSLCFSNTKHKPTSGLHEPDDNG